MADPNLTESAWQRAVENSARLYRTTAFGVAATLMTIIFGSVAAVASAGENTTSQIAVPILGGALALCLAFGILFAIQLVAAPVRQRNELRGAWTVSEIETVNVGLTLGNLHRKGNELVHRYSGLGIGREEEEELESWADGVVAFLVKHVPDDSTQAFIRAGESEAGAVPRLSARLQALQKIIDSLG